MIWFVTRHDDVVRVLLDDERFVRDPSLAFAPEQLEESTNRMPESFAFVEQHMLNRDGADHRSSTGSPSSLRSLAACRCAFTAIVHPGSLHLPVE